MPLSNIQLVASTSWSQVNGADTGFNPCTEGDAMSYTSTGLPVATWDQIFVESRTLTASSSYTYDLTSLANFVCESFSFAHVFSIMVQPVGANITIGPGASNPLQWFWATTTDTTQVNNNGLFLWADGIAAVGTVVDSTDKTITVTNLSGSASVTYEINILGSTT